jgi:hypothetical protein
MKQKLSTEEKIQKVETILKYYRLRGANKEKINDLKHQLLKYKQDEDK